ncbi:MAG TPA: MarR family transcriptional regulator [Xanthobacteraceae bacterium]|nr:MarR family transcriptional regulator [Xanthobacteraceae bacterium]
MLFAAKPDHGLALGFRLCPVPPHQKQVAPSDEADDGAIRSAEDRHSAGTSSRPLTAADYERLAEFRYALRRFLVFSEDAAKASGLTGQQHQALLAINAFGRKPMTTGELAKRLAIRHHSAVGLIDRLAAKSLVKRLSGPDDRRQVLLALTPKSDTLLAKLSEAHRRELKRLAPLFESLLGHFKPTP